MTQNPPQILNLIKASIKTIDEPLYEYKNGNLILLFEGIKFKEILKNYNYNFFDDPYLDEFAYLSTEFIESNIKELGNEKFIEEFDKLFIDLQKFHNPFIGEDWEKII